MAASKLALLESRVATLETKIERLEDGKSASAEMKEMPGDAWINKIYGAFADDEDYEQAMELGRKYRESLRPKSAKKKSRKTGKRSIRQ